jgi:hypothetical protein
MKLKYTPGWAGRTRELFETDAQSEDVKRRVVHLINESAPTGAKDIDDEEDIKRSLTALLVTTVYGCKRRGLPLEKMIEAVTETYGLVPEEGL